MEKRLFKFKEVPKDWALCFRSECMFRENCQRWIAGTYAPKTLTLRMCVTPQCVRQDAPCRFYFKAEPLLMARGFGEIFRNVRHGDYRQMKDRLMAYLGSERIYYYYKNGTKLLSPTQQEWIRQLFKRYGYSEEVEFNEFEELYDFPYVRP